MPWSNQSGGGGPWRPNNQGPWGQGPSGSGGGGNGQTPPDLEELLRRGQDKFKQYMPGGFGNGIAVAGIAVVAAVVWLLSGFYTVQPNEVGLNMVFGKFASKSENGLRYNWPYPIGRVIKLPVTNRNAMDVGFRARGQSATGTPQIDVTVPEESLMLTGDENIADVKFRVIWQISPTNPENFAFEVRNPVATLKAVSESIMREIVGRSLIKNILTAERKVIEPAARDAIQKVVNDYKTGILVLQVQLLSVDPPEQVIAAFRDVTAAQQDAERLRNEAQAYANRIVPEARGAAARILEEAEAYRQQTVADARGAASRFSQIYEQYKRAPQVTRERMYLETLEKVMGTSGKIILDKSGQGTGVVPYLPLGELQRARGANTGTGTGTQGGN